MGTEKKAAAEVQENQTEQAADTFKERVDALADKLKEKVEQVPLLKALIVPLDKLAEMRVKLEQDGTRENILCNKAAALMK